MSARREAANRPLTGGRWLAPLAGNWAEIALSRLSQRAAVVRVVVTGLRGSAPREPGACMLVDGGGLLGTIGGGRLEYLAIAEAHRLLNDRSAPPERNLDLVLGPQLGQCCGGRVALRLERYTRSDLARLGGAARAEREALRARRQALWVYGAGHVGQALVRLLMDLGLHEIRWIDSRPELLPAELAETVTPEATPEPAATVAGAPPQCRFVVLTHDHALDYALCRAVLERGDAAWLGLIGSSSKAARFRSRLLRDGIDREQLAPLACPVGVGGRSKLPGAIAIAIAAQLLEAQPATPRIARARASSDTGCSAECAGCPTPRVGA